MLEDRFRFLERELDYPDGLSDAEIADYQEWCRDYEASAREEVREADPVLTSCDYVSFVSRTRGRSLGRNRKPREVPRRRVEGWTEVELLRYQGRWRRVTDVKGGLDKVATEVLGDTVPAEDAVSELLWRLRNTQ